MTCFHLPDLFSLVTIGNILSLLAVSVSGNNSSLQWGVGEVKFVQVQMKPTEKWLIFLLQDTHGPLLVLKIKLLNSGNEGSVLRAALRSDLTHCLHLKFHVYFS